MTVAAGNCALAWSGVLVTVSGDDVAPSVVEVLVFAWLEAGAAVAVGVLVTG
jgi:hypothetical protein